MWQSKLLYMWTGYETGKQSTNPSAELPASHAFAKRQPACHVRVQDTDPAAFTVHCALRFPVPPLVHHPSKRQKRHIAAGPKHFDFRRGYKPVRLVDEPT